MSRYTHDFLLLICMSVTVAVLMEPKDKNKLHKQSDEPASDENFSSYTAEFSKCLVKKIYGTFECVNKVCLDILRDMNDKDQLKFGQVQLERSESQTRDLSNFNYDSKYFSNVIKAAARLVEQRNLKWDFSYMYPGLQMQITPALNVNGLLEFVVDEQHVFMDRQLGTGRMLMKNLVLPFLLGLKFNLASVIPLLFVISLIITKKALLVTKIAMVLSGLLGWSTFLSPSDDGGIAYGVAPGFLNGFNYNYDYNNVHGHHHSYRPYRNIAKSIGTYNPHVIKEVVDIYDSGDNIKQENSHGNSKNFVWVTNV